MNTLHKTVLAALYLGLVIWILTLAGKDDYQSRQLQPDITPVVKTLKWK